MAETTRGASAPAKYYPLLDPVVDRIVKTRALPPGLPEHRRMIMEQSRRQLAGGPLSRHLAEIHVLRYLLCEEAARHG